jgi:hypothetical protein
MRIRKFLTISFCLAGISPACFSQAVAYKLNSTASNLNSAAAGANNINNAVGNTANTVKNTVNTFQQVGSMFKKKDKDKEKAPESNPEPAPVAAAPVANSPVAAPSSGILIRIAGIDYSKLKQVEDEIKLVEGVSRTSKKFSTSGSTIEVSYRGKDDQLWDALPESTKSTLTLLDLGNGRIVLEQIKKESKN